MPEKSKTYEKKSPRVYIRTFGCQMNSRDSELLAGLLLEKGFGLAGTMDEADIVLFNTCSVRKRAETRAFNNVYIANRIKKHKPSLIIGVIGCTAQNYKKKILDDMPFVDLVCGPQEVYSIPDYLWKICHNRIRINKTSLVQRPQKKNVPQYRGGEIKAFVSIAEGCENFCSYCIVPYVRGKEVSRSASAIVAEIKDLLGRGYKEITLLGQNVNSYQGGKGFVPLLERIEKIPGKKWIRFMTSHPKDVGTDLCKAIRDLSCVCEHVHLPLQSGSDRILKRMNRKYTSAKYLDIVERLRKYVPDIAITTDIIVGFPGETEADYRATRKVMDEVAFDGAFIFKYSPRPPAVSSRMPDNVPESDKQERHRDLLERQKEVSVRRNKECVGKVYEVLGEESLTPKKGRQALEKSKGALVPAAQKMYNLLGRTRTNKVVLWHGRQQSPGGFVPVRITHAFLGSLHGELLQS